MNTDPILVEREIIASETTPSPWYKRVSWGAILAGVVIALLSQFALEMLGIAIGVGVIDAGETTIGPNFTSAIVVWLTVSTLLSLFAGGLVTGKLAGITDELDGVLHGIVMMGIFTFIMFFMLTSTATATVRGVSNIVSDGLSFVGATAADVSPALANAIELNDGTLEEIRADAEELLAEDASFTSLRIALDDYIFADEPGDDTRQAAIDALATQTTLTEQEAAQQLDEWEVEFRQTIAQVERQAEIVADDIADVVAATAGVIFAILVAGAFAAGAGGFVSVTNENLHPESEHVIKRRQTAEVIG